MRMISILNIINECDACSSCYSALVGALHYMNERGLTEQFVEEISIGQCYKGQTGELGVGDCTCEFNEYVMGCPPSKEDIIDFFMKRIMITTK